MFCDYVHRRIQDFVGGQGPLAPPPLDEKNNFDICKVVLKR